MFDKVHGISKIPTRFTHQDRTPAPRHIFNAAPARKGFLDRAHYQSLSAALPAHLRDIATFAYFTGMRQGELEALRWERVNFDEEMIRLEADETKNEESRYLPYGAIPELAEIIERRSKNRATELVFTRPDGSSLGCYRKAWNRACIKASLGRMCWKCKKCHRLTEVAKQPWPPEYPPKEEPPVCECGTTCHWHYEGLIFHDLRRTGVRNLRRAGVPESVAMKISGHKTREVFERYNIKDQRDIIEAMEKLARHQRAEDRKLGAKPN